MDSLTESEIAQIAKLQRDAGVQRLSSHFSWTEFSDERQCFHQEFVYDIAMFATDCGFTWRNVIQATVIAKGFFPQLDGLDVPKLLSLLTHALSQILPNLTLVQRHQFTKFLTDTCITRQRLFQAVVGGATNISITQLHLELHLPPTPCPLAQGTDLEEWEQQRQQDQLTSMLRQKEEELRTLRDGSRVTLGEVNVPEDEQLDTQGVLELVRATVKATEGQMLASLSQEASLLGDILQLKLQQTALATRGLQIPVPANLHPDTPAKGKVQMAKTKKGVKSPANIL